MSRRGLRDAVLTIQDGFGQSVAVKIGKGTISWTEKRNIEYIRNRGNLYCVKQLKDDATEVQFSFRWEWLSNITGVSIYEALTCSIEGWQTTGGFCEPPAVDLYLTITPKNCEESEIIVFNEFRLTLRNPSIREGQIRARGTVTSVISTIGESTKWSWTPFIPNQNINVLGDF
ncbi:MAG TPA: hypothetical protein ENK70_05755 [Methylophaga sp.]|nr:hypothetical protein [Methylophaga sp.]